LCFFGIAAAQEMYETAVDRSNDASTERTMDQGRQIFRFDTFGDESFWGDTLGLHKAIEGANLGGVGGGVSPTTALAVGLKVDVDALPPAVIEALKQGQVDLNSPATTLTLLKLNSVVGVTGFFNEQGTLRSVGIQCALCHSTVDNSFVPGIGHRLDGWAARDLNVGAIIALATLRPRQDFAWEFPPDPTRLGDEILAGISILTSRMTDNVHPTLSACNAPARSLTAESSAGCGKIPKPKTVVSPPHFSGTFHSPVSIVTEICFRLRCIYLAGDGSAAILCSMLPNRRRVRWLSASSSQ
jgi:hypothetical protein